MNNSYYPLLMVLLIVALGIGGRILLMRLVHTACPSLRFRIKAALFVLYTLALILMLRQVYLSVLHAEGSVTDLYQAMLLTLCAANTAVLFVAFLYRTLAGKHRLSGSDKMRLMDL